MQNRHYVLIFTLIILAIAVAGCSQQSDPEKVYWQYWEACSNGEFNDAALLLSENARESSRQLGACAFTHDAINTIEAQKGNPPRTFSEDPQVNVQEKATSMIWFDDQGNIATVILVMIEGEWKVTEATWSI